MKSKALNDNTKSDDTEKDVDVSFYNLELKNIDSKFNNLLSIKIKSSIPESIVEHFMLPFIKINFPPGLLKRIVISSILNYCTNDIKENDGKNSTNDIINSNKWNLLESAPSVAIHKIILNKTEKLSYTIISTVSHQ